MSARAILSPKVNSLQFEDRVLLLDVPAKIGRSHKDDQVSASNRLTPSAGLLAPSVFSSIDPPSIEFTNLGDI